MTVAEVLEILFSTYSSYKAPTVITDVDVSEHQEPIVVEEVIGE
ncbi:hypothetical protein Q4Q34_15210 [Flavivirga abyssicola]|nr:hypothetical protein [Flavivirga sp. MEBiC07777]WVK12564.1 hypothetical protein Q4Q34_15210 [Flavivirga sp. MEBiC07777]